MNTPHGPLLRKKPLAENKFKMVAIFQDGRHFGREILLLPLHLTHCTDFINVGVKIYVFDHAEDEFVTLKYQRVAISQDSRH